MDLAGQGFANRHIGAFAGFNKCLDPMVFDRKTYSGGRLSRIVGRFPVPMTV